MRQLANASRAVFASWMSERAQTYRRLQQLEDLAGTAVTVQAMVFGNRGVEFGAGVAFSRDPSTGEARPVIDVLFDAQGEDIVSGRRTPHTEAALVHTLPNVAEQLRGILHKLEQEFHDVQDVEFTIENGRLWMLQTRSAKRTPIAALRIAIDLVREGLITLPQALQQLSTLDVAALARDRLEGAGEPAAHGIGASGGVACGRVAFDSAKRTASLRKPRSRHLGPPGHLDLRRQRLRGRRRNSDCPRRTHGHAALVARQMGKPSVVGCETLDIDPLKRQAHLADATLGEGDWISIDGDNGAIYVGQRTVRRERPSTELAELDRWRKAAHPECAVG